MERHKDEIIVAPYDNKEAWEEADFICDGVEDEKELQYVIELASAQNKKFQLKPGTYNIRQAVSMPEKAKMQQPTWRTYTPKELTKMVDEHRETLNQTVRFLEKLTSSLAASPNMAKLSEGMVAVLEMVARHKKDVMKTYAIELHKIKTETIEAENSLDLVERAKVLYPGYKVYGFKLAEEQGEVGDKE